MFDMFFEDPVTQERKYVYQNSWEFYSGAIGAMIMTHADNEGLGLPPRLASVQIVLVPCGNTDLSEHAKKTLEQYCNKLEEDLRNSGISQRRLPPELFAWLEIHSLEIERCSSTSRIAVQQLNALLEAKQSFAEGHERFE